MNTAVKLSFMAASLIFGCVALMSCGEVANPFGPRKGPVLTPYPADFAIVIDEASDKFYARDNIRQVVTASDLMSRTTYTTLRDTNNTVASSFSHDQPVSQEQLQAMWNEIIKNKVMQTTSVWYYWKSNPDNYLRDERSIQIRANGRTATFQVLNHSGAQLRDLVFLVQAVRFPSPQTTAPIPAATAPAEAPAATAPAETPAATAPATQP